MTEIYLPIAGIYVNPLIISILGVVGGILSGLLGIGGGLLTAPGLMLLGIRPEVAVASNLNQILATSISGGLAYWHRNSLDQKLLLYILAGSLGGSALGLGVISSLLNLCELSEIIQFGYAFILPIIGLSILWDCWQRRREINLETPITPHGWKFWQYCPWQVEFPLSQLKTTLLAPILIGLISGFLVAIFGAGGGIVMVPAMIYSLGVPNRIAMGNSLLASACLTLFLTIANSVLYGSVDMVLAMLLTIGGVIGAQIGAWLAFHTKEYYLRILLALVILCSAFKLARNPFCVPAKGFYIAYSMQDLPPILGFIFNLHSTQPWVYSIAAVIWAILAGIIADMIFRRRYKLS